MKSPCLETDPLLAYALEAFSFVLESKLEQSRSLRELAQEIPLVYDCENPVTRAVVDHLLSLGDHPITATPQGTWRLVD